MVQDGDVILVHFLGEQPVGLQFPRHRNDWPLHVTLVPWFGVQDKVRLQVGLESVATNMTPIEAQYSEQVNFNPETRVSLVSRVPELQRLHTTLLAVADDCGAQYRSAEWIHGNYKPHVTHHDGQSAPQPGDTILVDTVSLVHMLPGNICEVVRHFQFKGHDETTA